MRHGTTVKDDAVRLIGRMLPAPPKPVSPADLIERGKKDSIALAGMLKHLASRAPKR